MSQLKRMREGKLYLASDDALVKMRKKARTWIDQFNAIPFSEREQGNHLIGLLFGSVGKDVHVNKPFYCDYGVHIHVGDQFYANYGCVFLDVSDIKIGDRVFLGPSVHIYTASHPTDKDVRGEGLEYGQPVSIGNDVWIGGHATINPGVTIGDDVIIGSGSVVTKDIPSHVIAAGNPCRIIRQITEQDRIFWTNERKDFLKASDHD